MSIVIILNFVVRRAFKNLSYIKLWIDLGFSRKERSGWCFNFRILFDFKILNFIFSKKNFISNIINYY